MEEQNINLSIRLDEYNNLKKKEELLDIYRNLVADNTEFQFKNSMSTYLDDREINVIKYADPEGYKMLETKAKKLEEKASKELGDK